MNKVYFFNEKSGDYGGVYVAAKTWKEARNTAVSDELISDHVDNPITEVEGYLCRKNKKPITTELEGILDIKKINEVGCAWWSCDNDECGGEGNFEILDDELNYKCRECGGVYTIPYVNC